MFATQIADSLEIQTHNTSVPGVLESPAQFISFPIFKPMTLPVFPM